MVKIDHILTDPETLRNFNKSKERCKTDLEAAYELLNDRVIQLGEGFFYKDPALCENPINLEEDFKKEFLETLGELDMLVQLMHELIMDEDKEEK